MNLIRKWLAVCLICGGIALLTPASAYAQCSICTKTAQQLGEKPAKGLNTGIVYLAFAPFLIVGYIGYRWWKSNQSV